MTWQFLNSKYIKDNKLRNIVLGISGGLDSAVMAVIGLKAINLLRTWKYQCGYSYTFIDVESKDDDLVKATALATRFHFALNKVNLTKWYQDCPFRIPNPKDRDERVSNGNIKCRTRMVYLFDMAGKSGGLVLDTDDLSEMMMGFWTINGDVGNVKVIQELTKDEVRDLGEYYGVPEIILNSAPGDGLGVTDSNAASDQLGMNYIKTDYLMSVLIRYGFDINGPKDQLANDNFGWLINKVALEIEEPVEKVLRVVHQALNTSFKRKYGDNVAILLPSRTAMGLPELRFANFSDLYFAAIKKDS